MMTAVINNNHSNLGKVRKNIYKTALNALYDKKKIWDQLNQDRKIKQEEKALEDERLKDKKLYSIQGKKFYKLIGDNVNFYVREDTLKDIPSTQFQIQLYTYSFAGMKRKDVALIKINKSNHKIFVSEDRLRVYFKPYTLEEER